jgi:hypothetical protein
VPGRKAGRTAGTKGFQKRRDDSTCSVAGEAGTAKSHWMVACSEAGWKLEVAPDLLPVRTPVVLQKNPQQVLTLIHRPDPPSSKNAGVITNFRLSGVGCEGDVFTT